MLNYEARCRRPDEFIRARMECKEGLFGIGGSSAKTDRKYQLPAWQNLLDISKYASTTGEGALGQGLNFWETLMSGSLSDITQLLAKPISNIQNQTEQTKKTTAEFGDRSGGTNAALQNISTTEDANIQALIDAIIPQAATQVTDIGQNLINTAVNASGDVAGTTTQARQNDVATTQAIQGAILSSLIDTASIGVNAATGGAGIGGFGEG